MCYMPFVAFKVDELRVDHRAFYVAVSKLLFDVEYVFCLVEKNGCEPVSEGVECYLVGS